jgi:small-conductance mechanosensitive channel
MKIELSGLRRILKKYSPLLAQRNSLWGVLIILSAGCHKEKPHEGYIAFYNYSSHDGISAGYVEIVVPVPFEETHSKFNDRDYSMERLVKGAELITSTDTIPLMYAPLQQRHQLSSLIGAKKIPETHSSYLALFPEPYKWGSLFQQDSLFSPYYSDIREIRYLDKSGKYHKLDDVTFQFLYFLDSKQVTKQSKEFLQKMKIELPPPVQID